MPGSKAEAAATVLGVGRSAYEYAFNYAKKRKQGGKMIIDHQVVAMMISKMTMLLDGARLQIWKAAWLADNHHPDARIQGLISKVRASEAAFEVCTLATEILGGAGIMYKWLKTNTSAKSYQEMNNSADKIPIGSNGLIVIPFGNGSERMFNNKNIGTHFFNLNLNVHSEAHLYRASLEAIAFSFVYGIEIMKNDGTEINIIKAGNDNLFQSNIFSKTFSTLANNEIEIYDVTGAYGAARAASYDNDISKILSLIHI